MKNENLKMADYIESTRKKNEEVMLAKSKAKQEKFEKQHQEKLRRYELRVSKNFDKDLEEAQSLL